jgi:hypothetical protein
MNSQLKAKALKLIKSHPKMSYAKFRAATKFDISDCYYYMLRGEVYSRGVRTNQKTGVYITITNIPTLGLTADTKKIIADLLRNLNAFQGSRLEVMENIEAGVLEIRKAGV